MCLTRMLNYHLIIYEIEVTVYCFKIYLYITTTDFFIAPLKQKRKCKEWYQEVLMTCGVQKTDIFTYGFLYCLWHPVHKNLNFHSFVAVPKSCLIGACFITLPLALCAVQ